MMALTEDCYALLSEHFAKAGLEVSNPATNAVIATVRDWGDEDVKTALEASHAAFLGWRDHTAKARSNILRKWYDLILENTEALAEIATLEAGKPLQESRGEVAYAAAFVEWFAEEAKRAYGDTIPTHKSSARIVTIKQPIGVTAAITPWNFPLAMITRKAGAALAAGCTMIVKPAAATPLSALALETLARQAGLPENVLRIVPSSSARMIGNALCESPLVRKLSFTGSTPVGKVILKQCADTVKRVSMELGGNAPLIIFDDADVEKAVAGTIASKFRNAGQTCVCSNRILVQAKIYDTFSHALKNAVAKLKIGNGMNVGTDIGPLIDKTAAADVQALVEKAKSAGAKVLTGGIPSDLGAAFFEPTILENVTNDMEIAQSEIFGPIAPLIRFETEDEAIEMANHTEYGLAAYVFTESSSRTWRVMEALEYGMVGINDGLISTELAPFGGVKESGLGREGSRYGLDEYLEIKYALFGGVS